MSFGASQGNDRLLELLADRAVTGLSAAQAAELEALLRAAPAEANDALDLAAAALDLAMMSQSAESPAPSMPASLRAALQKQGEAVVGTRSPAVTTRPDVIASIRPGDVRTSSGFSGLGWLAAAACLALAATAWLTRPIAVAPANIDPAAERTALLSAPDHKQWGWVKLGELENEPVSGDIVWSNSAQKGYMVFEGLKPNDPSKEQYQLWIFDPAQSDKTPIDGGVFDIAADGRTVVPMDPKIKVSDAVMFAITVEKPGGVVVSDRSRLVLLAKPS